MKKIAVLLAILLSFEMSGLGCGEEDIYKEIFTDRVSVIVNAQMKEAFLSETITAEDLGWDNIDRIEYNVSWFENTERGVLTIYLKKTGKRRVDQAIAHFETLDFVVSASYIGGVLAPA